MHRRGGDILVGTDTNACDALAFVSGRRARSRLVVVVDNVHLHTLSTIAAIAAEVVDDIVAIVHTFVELSGGSRTEARCARGVMGYQIVVERCSAATPVAAVSVCALRMTAVHQTLCNETPLYRCVLVAQNRQAFVYRPAHGTVIYHPVLLVETAKAVPTIRTIQFNILVAQTEAHVAHDDIVALDSAGIVGYADAIARSSLSGDGGIAADVQVGI